MSSRIGIVLQAIGVIALGSIVYLALLSPEDPDPLTGIEVENGVRITPPQVTGGRRHDDPESTEARWRHHHASENSERERNRNRNRPRRSATLPRLVATPPPSSAVPPPSAKPAVTTPIDTPSGSQYADGVARIIDMVGRARP